MGFDQIRLGGTAGFNRVRVNGPLPQDPVAGEELLAFQNPFLHLDEFLADDVALLLGVESVFQRAQELRACGFYAEGLRPCAQIHEWAADELRLPLPHQACIDVGAMHALRSQRLQAEGGRRRWKSDASADEEEDAAARSRRRADLFLKRADLFPVGFQSARSRKYRTGNWKGSAVRMGVWRHFRMELDREQSSRSGVGYGCHGTRIPCWPGRGNPAGAQSPDRDGSSRRAADSRCLQQSITGADLKERAARSRYSPRVPFSARPPRRCAMSWWP